MKYIQATRGASISLIFFTIFSLIVPGVGPSDEIEIILTVATFLFAILVGFHLSRLNDIYNNSKIISKDFENAVAEKIDSYYINAFDFKLGEHYKNTASIIDQVYKNL